MSTDESKGGEERERLEDCGRKSRSARGSGVSRGGRTWEKGVWEVSKKVQGQSLKCRTGKLRQHREFRTINRSMETEDQSLKRERTGGEEGQTFLQV